VRTAAPVPGLFVLALVSGAGIAMVHPEGLRALHHIEKLPAALGTSVFLIGGYWGFAGGGWLGALLVSSMGLGGLWWLLLMPVCGSVLVYVLRLRLAVETAADRDRDAAVGVRDGHCPFWPLFFMTVPVVLGLTVLPSLLPTYLNEQGLTLVAGGSANLAFGVGLAGGSLFWGSILRRAGQLWGATLTPLVGVPLLLVYVQRATQPHALWLLAASAFWVGAPYPLLVALARYARGPALGTRLAVIVGGAWGLASIALLGFGALAEQFGVRFVLYLGCGCFVVAVAVGARLLAGGRR